MDYQLSAIFGGSLWGVPQNHGFQYWMIGGPPILGNHHSKPLKKSPTSLGQLAALPNASFEVTASAMART